MDDHGLFSVCPFFQLVWLMAASLFPSSPQRHFSTIQKESLAVLPVMVIHIGLRLPLRQKEKTNMSGGTMFLIVYTFCENLLMKLVALYFLYALTE